jgi:hypothetical protein
MNLVIRLQQQPDLLFDLLEKYEREIELAEQRILLQGRTLEESNRDQSKWMLHYGTLKAEADSVVHYSEMRADQMRSDAFKRVKATSDRNLADRTIDKYVESDQDLINILVILFQVRGARDRLAAVVEAFKSRGFALRHITDARINSIHMAVL